MGLKAFRLCSPGDGVADTKFGQETRELDKRLANIGGCHLAQRV